MLGRRAKRVNFYRTALTEILSLMLFKSLWISRRFRYKLARLHDDVS